jgi:hypothetical protein
LVTPRAPFHWSVKAANLSSSSALERANKEPP